MPAAPVVKGCRHKSVNLVLVKGKKYAWCEPCNRLWKVIE